MRRDDSGWQTVLQMPETLADEFEQSSSADLSK
jgi:hypothetical protein